MDRDYWSLTGTSLATAFGSLPKFVYKADAEQWLVVSGENHAAFNMAYIGAVDDVPARFKELQRVARQCGVPIGLHLSHETADRFATQLPTPAYTVPLMAVNAVDVTASSSDRFEVESLGSDYLGSVLDLIADVFKMPADMIHRSFQAEILAHPDVEFAMAKLDGKLASVAMLIRVDGSVGIWNVATHPEMRRQGAAMALLSSLVEDERAKGAKDFFLLSSSAGKPLYERLGFKVVEMASVYRLDP